MTPEEQLILEILERNRPKEGECVFCRKPGVGMFYGNLYCEHCLNMNEELEELEAQDESGQRWYSYHWDIFIDQEPPAHFILGYCPECRIHCGFHRGRDFHYCPFCRGMILNPEAAAETRARREARRKARKAKKS